jgi:hypothetical protein
MDEQNSKNKKQSKWMIFSMVIVAAIVALAIFVVVSNLGARTDPSANSPTFSSETTASPTPAESTADDETSFCGLTAVELTGTLTEAPNATWQLLGTIYVPAVDGHGPGKIEGDGYRHCYSRTPTGAVLAMANYYAMASIEALREKNARVKVAPGPGRDAAIRKLETPQAPPTGNVTYQVVGFRVLYYDGNTAMVEAALEFSDGVKMAWIMDLVWAEGDWKTQYTNEGKTRNRPTAIQTLHGFIEWKA